jgi:hypothetical protein
VASDTGYQDAGVTFQRLTVWSAGGLAALFLAIQLVPVSRTNPPVTTEVVAPPEVRAILRGACYDCHSNETRWPWYSHVAPASWFLLDHIEEGRGDLNFSQWPLLDFEAQGEAFREVVRQLEKDEMPPKSYRLAHAEARLSDEEKATLIAWAREGQ